MPHPIKVVRIIHGEAAQARERIASDPRYDYSRKLGAIAAGGAILFGLAMMAGGVGAEVQYIQSAKPNSVYEPASLEWRVTQQASVATLDAGLVGGGALIAFIGAELAGLAAVRPAISVKA